MNVSGSAWANNCPVLWGTREWISRKVVSRDSSKVALPEMRCVTSHQGIWRDSLLARNRLQRW